MPVPGWWPDKLRPRSKARPGASGGSAASSPRKSVDLDYPSPSPTPRAREKARSLDSPAARHGGELQYKLPLPASDPDPETLAAGPLCDEANDAAAAGEGSSSVSSECSSPDDAPDHHVSSR
jgi:hypothetical protein